MADCHMGVKGFSPESMSFTRRSAECSLNDILWLRHDHAYHSCCIEMCLDSLIEMPDGN